ncbi:MAG TPA: hypothetical protein VF629_01000 [Hymenobacter sp.]|jgi:hypothetical protein|uniref:hypothetical protein n=1 Tax=Hymenobacter sp. TaxID=1898978 RepID=UPI002EDAB780
MAGDIDIDRLLQHIRALAKAQGMKPAQVADFNRLYQLYGELDDVEIVSRNDRTGVFRDEQVGPQAMSSFIANYLRRQAVAQEKYQQNRRYYLLLMSFYNAFVLPLEEDIAIVQSTQALDITSMKSIYADRESTVRLKSFNVDKAAQALFAARTAFAGIGRLLFPATFDPNDFTAQSTQG